MKDKDLVDKTALVLIMKNSEFILILKRINCCFFGQKLNLTAAISKSISYLKGLDLYFSNVQYIVSIFCSYILRRPQNFTKSSPYFWLALNRTKVRWRLRKILWPSQNIWAFSPETWPLVCPSFSGYEYEDAWGWSRKSYDFFAASNDANCPRRGRHWRHSWGEKM